MTIAQTILQQLGGNRFTAMTGAKLFVDVGNGLKFRIPLCGSDAKRINAVMITLDHDDTYTVTFGRVFNNGGFVVYKTSSMVYAEDLQRVFTEQTGLDTHL